MRPLPYLLWLAILAGCVLGPRIANAQFAPEDQVRLRRNEPLYFKDAIFRQGRTGETFRVLKYDAVGGRVFLEATGNDGKLFALNCADQAVEPMPKDYWALLQQGIRTMQQTDMAGARALFVRASTGEKLDKTAVVLALHCEALIKGVVELAEARAIAVQAQPEIARILRNAQVTDRPDRLNGGNGNQIRAEELRTQARILKQQTEQAIAQAESSLEAAVNAASATADSLIASGSLSLGLPMSDSLASFASKHLPGRQREARPDGFNRAEITARINAASDALARATALMEAKQLHAARSAIAAGLEHESGRGELKSLRIETETRLGKVATLVELATSLKAQSRFDEALASLAKAEALCADDEALRIFASDLRVAIPQ